MRLTKLEHSALVIEHSGAKLFIDPGKFTTPITEAAGAVAVVITHQHDDHWTPDQLRRIVEANTEVRLFGPAGVAAAAADFDIEVVDAGDEVEAGPFRLRFFGGRHAIIHRSIPVIDNVGVLVNDALYYAGDSFTVPEGVAVEVLAAPAAAPWMKISEAMDYIEAIAPRRTFPTHEMLLSRAGKTLSNTRLAWADRAGRRRVRAARAGRHAGLLNACVIAGACVVHPARRPPVLWAIDNEPRRRRPSLGDRHTTSVVCAERTSGAATFVPPSGTAVPGGADDGADGSHVSPPDGATSADRAMPNR